MPVSHWKKLGDSLGQLAALAALVGGCLVVSWEAWPSIDGWHQQHLAEQLADRIAALPDDEVKVPLHQLASIGTPALGALVEAAASPRDAVARVAQQEIDIAFSACLMQVRESSDEEQAETLVALAKALDSSAERFGPSGQRWAEGLTLRMIEVADQLPVDPATRLLIVASRVLDKIPARGPRLRSVKAVVELPPLDHYAVVGPPPIDVRSLAVPSERVISVPRAAEPDARPPVTAPEEETPAGRVPTTASEMWSPQWLGVRTISPLSPLEGDASLSVRVRPGPLSAPLDVPTPLDFQRMLSDLRRQPTEMLIKKLPTADKFSAGAIRKVLTERGIDAAQMEMISRIESADEADRLHIVAEVSQLPAASARRLLRLLLDDPSGEVRLRALTTLATTNDPGLAELARTIASEDMDPRVANLASKLLRQ